MERASPDLRDHHSVRGTTNNIDLISLAAFCPSQTNLGAEKLAACWSAVVSGLLSFLQACISKRFLKCSHVVISFYTVMLFLKQIDWRSQAFIVAFQLLYSVISLDSLNLLMVLLNSIHFLHLCINNRCSWTVGQFFTTSWTLHILAHWGCPFHWWHQITVRVLYLIKYTVGIKGFADHCILFMIFTVYQLF